MNDKILFGKGGGVYVCVVIVVGGVWGGVHVFGGG